jgi:hypothetical protein
MITAQGDTRGFLRNPVWQAIIGIFLFIVLAILFFMFGSSRLRHDLRDEAPPAGSEPAPGSVVPH